MAKLDVMQVKLPTDLKNRIMRLERSAASRHELIRAALDAYEGSPESTLAESQKKVTELTRLLDQYGCSPDVVKSMISEKEQLYKENRRLQTELDSRPAAQAPEIDFTPAEIALLKRLAQNKAPAKWILENLIIPFLENYPNSFKMTAQVTDQDFQAYQEYLQSF